MKRRELLKTAGTMLLTAPAVRASALMKSNVEPAPQSGVKNLIVTFSGAFCFWQDGSGYKVMVPPVPVDPADENSHRAWAGTTANTKELKGFDNFTLTIGRYTPPPGGPVVTGTDAFTYRQELEKPGKAPLLNLFVPMPSRVVGIRPTGVKIVCQPGKTCPYSEKDQTLASGLSFVYPNVDLDHVLITTGSDQGKEYYQACFTNDAYLQEATLAIHLTPLSWVLDPHHEHAKHVWKLMLSMYRWMEEDIEGIHFCNFDPSACPASCNPKIVGGGPSTDCQVPIMVLPLGGGGKSQKPGR